MVEGHEKPMVVGGLKDFKEECNKILVGAVCKSVSWEYSSQLPPFL